MEEEGSSKTWLILRITFLTPILQGIETLLFITIRWSDPKLSLDKRGIFGLMCEACLTIREKNLLEIHLITHLYNVHLYAYTKSFHYESDFGLLSKLFVVV